MTEFLGSLILACFAGVLIVTGQPLGVLACAGSATIFAGIGIFGKEGEEV